MSGLIWVNLSLNTFILNIILTYNIKHTTNTVGLDQKLKAYLVLCLSTLFAKGYLFEN